MPNDIYAIKQLHALNGKLTILSVVASDGYI